MKLQVKTTFDFGKLARFVESEAFTSQVSKMLGGGVIESSRAFMKSGGVTPKLKQSTIDIRKMRGSGGTTPLYESGDLAKSLKVKKDGIWGLHYGKYQYEGFTPKKIPVIKNDSVFFVKNKKNIKVPPRDFFAMDAAKMKKPINNLMKQIGKALKK